jgi:MscS family membrane protein
VVLLDKPFEIGDKITVEDYEGIVENIGFRSTRIRTLDGNLVVVPNSELVNKTVLNIGKRSYIRHLANITITYDTPPEKVERAITIIKQILENNKEMHPNFPPRVYFDKFNDTSLNLIMIYWYYPPDEWQYMAFSEKVNMEILKRFNEEGIEFAFPTQTLYLANDSKRQLALKMLDNSIRHEHI